jgi:tetratricopeptide (TPR) repeat protein
VDFSQYPNPYDFAYPVTDENLFVGRDKELEDIKYYLDHAAKARRPISLALIGERASGKTSFLNIIEIEGKKRDFCCGRVDLDEGDASSQLNFFFKVFDGILGAACEKGAYGGLEGKTFEAYFEMVNTYEVPDDKTFCPFFFPIQYARAMAAGNLNAAISDHQIKRDLTNIAQETQVPILILFDETDVLAQSRSHLQKIRNIFMNTPGYMLVFSGTPRLFPIMDDVFSPIIRQFKKIPVKNFEQQKQTRDCIIRPLQSVGIFPGRLLDPETYRDVSELHHISEGKPYEIQLICHTMFRRVQMGRAERMELDVNVLEEVRRELESGQDISDRPVIEAILKATPKELEALNLLCMCKTEADLDLAASLDHILFGKSAQTLEHLKRALQDLKNQGLLSLDSDGRITFVGDQFDRIYAKYLSKERGLMLPFYIRDLPDYWEYRIQSYLNSQIRASGVPVLSQAIVKGMISLTDVDCNRCIQKLEFNKAFQAEDEYPLWEETVVILFLAVKAMSLLQSPRMLRVGIELPWLESDVVYFPDMDLEPKEGDSSSETIFSETHFRYLAEIEDRVRIAGGRMRLALLELPLRETEASLKRAMAELKEESRSALAKAYFEIAVAFHLGGVRPEATILYLEASLAFNIDLDSSTLISCGYIYLFNGRPELARPLLEKAAHFPGDDLLVALAYHNLGILESMIGNVTPAVSNFETVIEILHMAGVDDYPCLALLFLKLEDGTIRVEEVRNPNLCEVTAESLAVLQSLGGADK